MRAHRISAVTLALVLAACSARVPAQRVGERVWLWNAARGRAHGTASQWLCQPNSSVMPP